jgi:hypothetical protein
MLCTTLAKHCADSLDYLSIWAPVYFICLLLHFYISIICPHLLPLLHESGDLFPEYSVLLSREVLEPRLDSRLVLHVVVLQHGGIDRYNWGDVLPVAPGSSHLPKFGFPGDYNWKSKPLILGPKICHDELKMHYPAQRYSGSRFPRGRSDS